MVVLEILTDVIFDNVLCVIVPEIPVPDELYGVIIYI